MASSSGRMMPTPSSCARALPKNRASVNWAGLPLALASQAGTRMGLASSCQEHDTLSPIERLGCNQAIQSSFNESSTQG